MYDFILQIIFMLSIGIVIYLMALGLPRVGNEKEPKIIKTLADLTKSIPLDRIDAALNKVLEKALRRFRLIILRVDNWVNSFLGKVRKSNTTDEDDQSTLFRK
ncbi:MAG: hypothetical protein A3A04_01260 [Candidatus Harrisonbacteria bacterium RIFCSPLOWO2_01_FULL_40_28]|uniref:Uncharacterized protein n=2 Tax=Candidatus Harrisoniibacteriota TaxID=1817905 RepID=A0A1G1ZX55_9BACT|nr:MAG: hypothetical protein A3A04_01260 [Candidatus Harrisonbacteria bacterium RIFCSPLOWO2_01_FULL_40_28]OGY69051.1 MAG: hypothetical protein A2586_02885 [Candidatus Harrisonbacteria bacterium RIFOXYD1_FULL_40_9]